MRIDKWKLWKTLLMSWFFTFIGFFNIVILLFAAALIALRFAGPAGAVGIIMPSMAMMILIFLTGEIIVNLIFGAERPHPERDARFLASMKRVKKKTRMWVMPRAWIVPIGQPNAMAYGPGIPFFCAVGVSRELIEMLNDDELDGVIAHEFAHIKCRDTGILAVISFILNVMQKFRGLLTNKRALVSQTWITWLAGWVIYWIGRLAFAVSQFSISQEREIAADALSAYYNDDARPLISALRKLHQYGRTNKPEGGDEPFFKDLMVAHPGMEERIESLDSLMKRETLLITSQPKQEETV